jgi:photosystem II stability/assembly factor-like uncharacterized protein
MRAIATLGACSLTTAALLGGFATTAVAARTPSNFEPASVSFASAAKGFVLGEVPCGEADCPSVVVTSDAGKTWTTVGVPNTAYLPLAEQNPRSVSEIIFASAKDGWAYGPALWATTNGGVSWHQEKASGPILDMGAAGNHAYAIVGNCYATTPKCSPPKGELEESPIGGSTWAPVKALHGYGPTYFTSYGPTVFVALWPKPNGPAKIWQSSNGTTWKYHKEACYQPSRAIDLAGLAAGSASTLFELCAGNPGAGQEAKYVELSTNSGASAHVAGKLPLGGLTDGFASANTRDVVVGAASGATFLYRSGDAAKTWAARSFNDGGAGINDLQFAGPALGAAIEGRPGLGASSDRLWLSRDAGSTWTSVRF